MTKSVKCVLIGDDSVGKRGLIKAYTTELLPNEEYKPSDSAVEEFSTNTVVDGQEIKLNLWYTAGASEYDSLRPISYKGTDVFLVLFSIVDVSSFEHVSEKWYPEIQKACPNTPILLVGTKADVRDDQEEAQKLASKGVEIVDHLQANEMTKKIGAVKYLECSSFVRKSLKSLVEEVVRAAQANQLRIEMEIKQKDDTCSCTIL